MEKEYVCYALSPTKGWVAYEYKYNSGKESGENKPADTVLEMKYITEGGYSTEIYHRDEVIFESSDIQAVAAAKQKFNDKPKENPYL